MLEFILMRMTGNPFIAIDELDKAGHVRSDKGRSFGLAEGLLPLLEPATAADWTCPYFGVRFGVLFGRMQQPGCLRSDLLPRAAFAGCKHDRGWMGQLCAKTCPHVPANSRS